MTFVSYAQNFEDVMLWRALRHVAHGFYIDVGAGHPDESSVTRAFYDRGWRGLNIEPSEHYFQRLAAARPLDTKLPAVHRGGRGDPPTGTGRERCRVGRADSGRRVRLRLVGRSQPLLGGW